MRAKSFTAVLAGWLLLGSDGGELARVRRIYEELARAASDGRRPPTLVIRTDDNNPGRFRVAYYDQKNRQISLDERVVHYCFGKARPRDDACVAFFLGHELAHFYKDHGWGMDVSTSFSGGTGASGGGASASELSALEAQADQAGGLYAHLAGYDALPWAPRILSDVYKLYGIEDRIPGYPPLEERQQIARRADAALGRMTVVFDMGVLLFLLDRQEESGRCFEWIAQSFPSREILNNAGLAKALAAAKLFPKGRHALQYPWTLDGESRLETGPEQRRGEEPEQPAERQARLLEDAKTELESALSKDPDYPVARLNLALVEDLRGEYGSAADHAKRACAAGSRAKISSELCDAARAIIAAHAAGRVYPLAARKRGGGTANRGPAIAGLPEPASVRFTADSGEVVAIPPSSASEATLTVESKITASFTALRLRMGTEKLLVTEGSADREPLPEGLDRLKQAPDATRQTASGFVDLYQASELFVFHNRDSRIVHWMRYAWAE